MEKLLIVGLEQVVGANLGLALSDSFSVLGLSHQEQLAVAGCHAVACNLEDRDHVAWQIRQFSPQWTIFCGALSRSSWDAPTGRENQDAALAATVASAAAEVESRLAVISSDGVFSGPKIFHDEQSPQQGMAGAPRAEAARALEASLAGSTALIVRTNAYGWSACDSHVGFAEQLVRGWEDAAGDGLRPLADTAFNASPLVCATPILASDLALLLQKAYTLNLRGILHVAGAERASQRRFAVELSAALGLPANTVAHHEAPPVNSGGRIPARLETSLVSLRAQNALQTPLPMLREGLIRFAAQVDDGFRQRLRGEGVLAHAA